MGKERKFSSLEDWRKAEGRAPTTPTCQECGKPLRDAKYTLCYDCNQKRKVGQGGPDGRPSVTLPDGYLQEGYFDSQGDLREELITTQALQCAQTFADIRLTGGQLRRFFAHARQAGRRLEYGESFHVVRPSILEMRPLVADAVGRADRNGVGDYREFMRFMDRNVALAAT